jgi:hypothetical protein
MAIPGSGSTPSPRTASTPRMRCNRNSSSTSRTTTPALPPSTTPRSASSGARSPLASGSTAGRTYGCAPLESIPPSPSTHSSVAAAMSLWWPKSSASLPSPPLTSCYRSSSRSPAICRGGPHARLGG